MRIIVQQCIWHQHPQWNHSTLNRKEAIDRDVESSLVNCFDQDRICLLTGTDAKTDIVMEVGNSLYFITSTPAVCNPDSCTAIIGWISARATGHLDVFAKMDLSASTSSCGSCQIYWWASVHRLQCYYLFNWLHLGAQFSATKN